MINNMENQTWADIRSTKGTLSTTIQIMDSFMDIKVVRESLRGMVEQ